MLRRLVVLFALSLLPLAGSAQARPDRGAEQLVQVVVGLEQRPLGTTRWLAGADAQARTLEAAQARVERRIETSVPGARVRWHYQMVVNGFSVVLPQSSVSRLEGIPGVARVFPNARYTPQLDRTPQQIGAPALWQPGLTNAGDGIKIAIIDEGIDQSHPFFNPQGYRMPAGFPKGQRDYTTAKVIVARAFPPPSPAWRHASKPFDPDYSSHGTHVAGIAAGNANTAAAGERISGVAPRAYLGNYKALTIPTAADVGLDGNSPELVAAIEAAVKDGMDVINMSLGEPEVEPAHDIVAQALTAAARAGVVPVIAAGNDYGEFGRGSLSSPGSTRDAITVGAVTSSRVGPAGVVASFSSSGPTPLSLQLKPEVSAPGVNVLSAAPGAQYTTLSGTSMAAPHVAGAVALLLQRHPSWTPAQVKSALALTGDRAFAGDSRNVEASTIREGGGVVNLQRANDPLVFATPVALSFGLVSSTATLTQAVTLTDAGGGAGEWAVTVEPQTAVTGATIAAPPAVTVPSALPVTVTTAGAAEAEVSGFVVLTRGTERRRIPYWFRVADPALATARTTPLSRAGVYRGTTPGRLDARLPLPLSRKPRPAGLPDRPVRPGARLPAQAAARCGELRRRRPLDRRQRERLAAHDARGRREPAHRLRGAAVQPQPVSQDLPPACARRGGDHARRRQLRHRLRHARRTGSRARSRSDSGSATPLRRRSSSRSARSGGVPSSRSARPTRAPASTPPRSSCGSTAASARPGSPPAASSWRRTD